MSTAEEDEVGRREKVRQRMGRRRRSRGIEDMLVKCDGRLKKLQNFNGGIEEKKKAFCRREKWSGVALSLSFMENLRMERDKF